jgi:negative regulator of sigma E activity
MPAHLAARIETALATEATHRAAGAPPARSLDSASPAAERAAERPGRRWTRPAWTAPALGFTAAAAAVALVVVGGVELVGHLGGGSSGESATSSGSKALAPRAALPEPGRHGAARAIPPPAVSYRRDGHTVTIQATQSGTNYQRGRLTRQAVAKLSQVNGAGGVEPQATPEAQGGTNTSFGPTQTGSLDGCVGRIADGARVELVDLARFAGSPATIIITAAHGRVPAQVWVVGSGCTATASDVLAHQRLPGR